MRSVRPCLPVVLLLALFMVGCSTSGITETNPGQHPIVYTKEYKKTVSTNCLFYLPKDYGKEKKQWPLVLFLHGAGERGSDISLVSKHGPPMLASEGKDLPFILISPQCPENLYWGMDSEIEILDALLKDVQSNYDVDPNRIYITGLSMGGFGTWEMLARYPNRFAAAIPICGGGDSTKAYIFKDVPIWVFHGAKDNIVPLSQSQSMVNALKACGGNPKFTIYPNAEHNSWAETYNNPEVFDWLLKQSKK
ncbi:MAG: prolyl oligopeptidase family serine peptidase [Bacteroidota bacterium]|nr:prolyl oligopeptidase family serine peptidase [Bacteroidota bacterium]MDP4194529.1 prolyl oligopeptidase family serine peptidase [Bacteroidota bacterium]